MHVTYNEPHYTRGPHSIMKCRSLQSYCYSALNNDKEKKISLPRVRANLF